MDGTHFRSLGLGDWSISFLTKSNQQNQRSEDAGKPVAKHQTPLEKNQNPTKHINLDLDNNDHVSSNARSSQFGATLYVFEDNEAVIKMIIKGRSPTMRHVPRTHRVALDWLFERINQDPKIQIRKIDTKHQQAGISHVTNGTVLLICSMSSHFSSLLHSDFQLDQLHQNDGEKDARTGRRRQQDRGKVKTDDDEPGRLRLDKYFEVRLRRKDLGYSKHPVEQIGQVQGNLT